MATKVSIANLNISVKFCLFNRLLKEKLYTNCMSFVFLTILWGPFKWWVKKKIVQYYFCFIRQIETDILPHCIAAYGVPQSVLCWILQVYRFYTCRKNCMQGIQTAYWRNNMNSLVKCFSEVSCCLSLPRGFSSMWPPSATEELLSLKDAGRDREPGNLGFPLWQLRWDTEPFLSLISCRAEYAVLFL